MKLKNVKVLALLVFGFVACNPAEIIQPPPESPPTVIPPPAGLTGPVKAALYDGATVRLWDGVNAVEWKTGAAVHGNGRKIAVGRTLYFMEASGAVSFTLALPADPAGVAVIGDPDVYTFETITNADAFALDWSPPTADGGYTRIWKNGVGDDWHVNKWVYDHSFEAANGDAIVVDVGGHFWDIMRPELANGLSYQPIAWAWEGGPVMVMPTLMDGVLTVYDAAHPAGVSASWTGGNARANWGEGVWTEFGGMWYDARGDSYDPATNTFHAGQTPMVMWTYVPSLAWCSANYYSWPQTSDYPTVLYAYQDDANMYWIECNTGLLVQWCVQTGVITRMIGGVALPQLYLGDGHQDTGRAQAKSLQPELIDGKMYFHAQGTLWRMDTASTIISSFSADQELWVMR
jgi:hypothetical protein